MLPNPSKSERRAWPRLLVGAATAVMCASAVAVGASSSATTVKSSSPTATPSTASDSSFDEVAATKWALFDKYCSKCHNVEDWAGGIAFESLSPHEIPKDAETWEKAIRKLRGRLMPPAGQPQPDSQSVQSLVSWLETNIDTRRSDTPTRAAWDYTA